MKFITFFWHEKRTCKSDSPQLKVDFPFASFNINAWYWTARISHVQGRSAEIYVRTCNRRGYALFQVTTPQTSRLALYQCLHKYQEFGSPSTHKLWSISFICSAPLLGPIVMLSTDFHCTALFCKQDIWLFWSDRIKWNHIDWATFLISNKISKNL